MVFEGREARVAAESGRRPKLNVHGIRWRARCSPAGPRAPSGRVPVCSAWRITASLPPRPPSYLGLYGVLIAVSHHWWTRERCLDSPPGRVPLAPAVIDLGGKSGEELRRRVALPFMVDYLVLLPSDDEPAWPLGPGMRDRSRRGSPAALGGSRFPARLRGDGPFGSVPAEGRGLPVLPSG